MVNEKEELFIGHLIKSQEWFENKVHDYHGNKVKILSKYNGSEKPIDFLYHCDKHGDTYGTVNAKNICKSYYLPCKKCQSIRKSNASQRNKKDKSFYYNRLVEYCNKRDGEVLEKEWTRAKDTYHFKCNNPNHPVFKTTADALYSGEHWCPYCSGRLGDFSNELFAICKSKEGELLSEYRNASNYLTVRCNKHNYVWDILPSNIIKGKWCPICSMGFNEKVVWDYFTNMQCNIKIQYSFDDLWGKNNEKLKFDFAVLDDNDTLLYLVEVDDEEHKDRHLGNSPRQIKRQEAIKRDRQKDNYCQKHGIPLYRMEVPFRSFKKWAYEDYYRYINSELKFIVNLAHGGGFYA